MRRHRHRLLEAVPLGTGKANSQHRTVAATDEGMMKRLCRLMGAARVDLSAEVRGYVYASPRSGNKAPSLLIPSPEGEGRIQEGPFLYRCASSHEVVWNAYGTSNVLNSMYHCAPNDMSTISQCSG